MRICHSLCHPPLPPCLQVPFFFKHAVDALSLDPTGATTSPYMGMLHMAPVALVLGYGAARAGGAFCGEMRNIVFAKVESLRVQLWGLGDQLLLTPVAWQ